MRVGTLFLCCRRLVELAEAFLLVLDTCLGIIGASSLDLVVLEPCTSVIDARVKLETASTMPFVSCVGEVGRTRISDFWCSFDPQLVVCWRLAPWLSVKVPVFFSKATEFPLFRTRLTVFVDAVGCDAALDSEIEDDVA
jgi:hypothetical protein